MRRILVLRGGALGDFIVTLPALALLRKKFPAARIELAGNATAAALGHAAGLLDAVHSQHESRWASLHRDQPLPAELARELAAFDLVLNFWPDPNGELHRHFPLHAAQIFISAPALPTRTPAAAHYCEPLRPLGLTTETHFHLLAVGRGLPTPPRTIAIHPGSGSPKKNWPLARWISLCTWLTADHHADLLIVTGEADSAAATALARFGTPAHQIPLAELAAQLARCRLFLGHDSGISHLAAACGVPSVLLFGPTDPAMWAPPAPHVRVLQCGPELSSVSVADVQREVETALRDRT